MQVQISVDPITTLATQSEVSIAFAYKRILDLEVVNGGLGGFHLTEKELEVAQIKDYDSVEAENPASWTERFDVNNWGFIVARINDKRVGGAVLAFDTPGVHLLEDRRDLALLWDIRVKHGLRGQGLGAALFQAAEKWALKRGCSQLKIETQNTNYAACKFYAAMGCTLQVINRRAYPNLPEEVQMLWYKDLQA